MANNRHAIKNVRLIRSEDYGYGFSILGGAGSELPPVIFDIIEGSPASRLSQLSPGDIIWEINGKEVLSCTTKEILTYLRLSPKELHLTLKTDASIKDKIRSLKGSCDDPEVLRRAITESDLIGVKQILADRQIISPLKTSSRNEHSFRKEYNLLPKSELSFCEISKTRTNESDLQFHRKEYEFPLNYVAGEMMFNTLGISHPSNSATSSNSVKDSISCSMPSSPNDRELDGIGRGAMGSPHSMCSPIVVAGSDNRGSFIYPVCASVRMSKSEDYLQHEKDNFNSVNIDLDDDITASLNTLLDTTNDLPVCNSFNSRVLKKVNNIGTDAHTVWTVDDAVTPSPDSCERSSHDSDSPLIHSPSASPQSPSSSIQYSCGEGGYDEMYSCHGSVCSSNHSENECSNSSSESSPDTDIPDELEWDDPSPSFSQSNQLVNGHSEKSKLANGNSLNLSMSSTDSSISEKNKYSDENKIIIKVVGPKRSKRVRSHSSQYTSSVGHHSSEFSFRDQDQTPTNTPPETPGSGTLSPETLAYQQLWESEEEITCLSEKSDESNGGAPSKPLSHHVVCASSPPLSEDESDIESLHSFHYSPKAVDLPSVIRLAKRLYSLDGFKKSDISRHLCKNNEFSKAVAEEYLHYFDFKGDTLDGALEKFLDRFCLAGETQERERVLVHFSKHFLDCNPGSFNSQDAVHTLTCAIMLLNTDLHNQNIGRKMTCSEFIDNLAELNDGANFSPDILKSIYDAIKKKPLKWAVDEEAIEVGGGVKSDNNQNEACFVIGSNPFLATPVGSGVIYKKGYIMRKCCIEPNGKRTAFGKRSWRMWFCVLQDLVLYLHKDEQGARRGPLPQIGPNAVRLHHALALSANDYAKKEHVFRLKTADQAEYLLQTSDKKELQAWIDAINFVASSLSAPPMPGAVGSSQKFQRPLLPCSITKYNIVEQLNDHTNSLSHLEMDLEDHRSNPTDKNAKASVISNYREKEMYLTYEVRRYQTYVTLLRCRLDASGNLMRNVGGASASGLDIIDLPVFEVKSLSALGDAAREAENRIVPPPIPERSRGGTSIAINEATREEVLPKSNDDQTNKMEMTDRGDQTDELDPRIGTMEKIKAIFKLNKRKSTKREYEHTQGERGDKSESSNPEIPTVDPSSPPSLPPKPLEGSPIRLNVGTRFPI